MMVYRPPIQHAPTPVKVVLMSGLSDPSTCALSTLQTNFLRSLRAPEDCKVWWNFPFVASAPPACAPPLWLASGHNLHQFICSSSHAYRQAARRHWQALSESTNEIIVIALSCGLEILNNCIGDETRPRLCVFAFGPVAWKRPRFPCILIQGGRDYLSRTFFRNVDLVMDGVGHMQYLQQPHAANIINDRLCNSTFKSSAPVSTCRAVS